MMPTEQSTETKVEQQHPTAISNFFSHVMSVDETRVSLLMICLLLSLIFGAYMYFRTGAISSSWVDIVETFAYCVTGINVAGAFANKGGFRATISNMFSRPEDRR